MNYRKQLSTILKASDWSQERLARALDVSFPTLNSWVNGKSEPRSNAIVRIQALYFEIVGVDDVDEETLADAKTEALKLKLTANKLLKNTELLDRLTLHMTYHTNTIEGSTMTLSDVEEVLVEHKVLTNRTAIEQAEARNHKAALHWLIEQIADSGDSFIVNEDLIRGLNLRLMNGITGDAGQYRNHSARIMGTHVPLANYVKIPDLVKQLCNNLKKEKIGIIESLAGVHSRFEKIHPFSDGNGRTGRLIMLAQALSAGLVPPIVSRERKQAYYKYLENAQLKDVYGPLELFISESIVYANDILHKEQKV